MSGVCFPAWLHVRVLKPWRDAGPSDMVVLWEKGTRVALSLLIVTILAGFTGGVINTFLSLHLLWTADVEQGLRHLIVTTLTLGSIRVVAVRCVLAPRRGEYTLFSNHYVA